jgi:hypothetical protein
MSVLIQGREQQHIDNIYLIGCNVSWQISKSNLVIFITIGHFLLPQRPVFDVLLVIELTASNA